MAGSPAIPRVGTKMVPIGPQRLGLFGRLYRALRNTKYGRLLLELMTRTLGCLILAGLQHPGPLRGPPTAGPTLAMTNLPSDNILSSPLIALADKWYILSCLNSYFPRLHQHTFVSLPSVTR